MSSASLPVLIIAPDAGGTGSVAGVVRQHARELARHREVILISGSVPAPSIQGATQIRVPSHDFVWLRRFGHVPREVAQALAIRRVVRRICAERAIGALMVHSHALGAIVGRVVRDRFGVPYLIVVHADIYDRLRGTYDPLLTGFYRWVTPIAYRHAALILAISRAIDDAAIRHGGNAEHVRIVPNGIDPAEIGLPVNEADMTTAKLRKDGPLRMLFVGRLSVEKGVSILLNACADLKRSRIPFELQLVGDGPLRSKLDRQVIELGLSGEVTFLGSCQRDALGSLYRAADITCVPSLSEPQGIVVLESLIAGTPVVASGVGGIPDMVRDGVNGRLVPPGQPRRLAEALAGLSEDREVLAQLAVAAHPSVELDYAWTAIGQRLVDVVDEIMSTTSSLP